VMTRAEPALPTVVVEVNALLHLPTPEPMPTRTPAPAIVLAPTATAIPYYHPRHATPGHLYRVPPPPPPTPTPYPACGARLPAGSLCVAPVPTMSVEPREGRR
jgi:hypothetical protein